MTGIVRRGQKSDAGRIESSEQLGTSHDVGVRRLSTARAWTKAREIRNRILGDDLFADPAWDMLLALYIAHVEYRMLTVSVAVSYAHVPATTGLRWLAKLEDAGLISRRTDMRDGRRIFVQMLPDAIEAIEAILDLAVESDARLGLSRLYFQG